MTSSKTLNALAVNFLKILFEQPSGVGFYPDMQRGQSLAERSNFIEKLFWAARHIYPSELCNTDSVAVSLSSQSPSCVSVDLGHYLHVFATTVIKH